MLLCMGFIFFEAFFLSDIRFKFVSQLCLRIYPQFSTSFVCAKCIQYNRSFQVLFWQGTDRVFERQFFDYIEHQP